MTTDPQSASTETDGGFTRVLAHVTPARLAVAQGVYYALSGVWPLFSIASFVAVTGPKTDLWLVRTVGALLFAIGISLVAGARRVTVSGETALLASSVGLVVFLIDVIYVFNGTIGAVYLLDGIVEAVFVTCWLRQFWLSTSNRPDYDAPGSITSL